MMKRVTHCTEPWHSNEEVYKYRHADSWKLFMKYAIEMGSGAMRSFIQDWSRHKPPFMF
jgi:hypothetical protein